ncbi:MAG: hypothetical protein H6737_28115 [Alphaproteobacteria bacterium]|nr:hypothetical protein [Alphaproteobacteria bacterium]
MRWLPLLASGCLWLGDDRDARRLDADQDGVPTGYDCNDRNPTVTTLFATHGAIACGETVAADFDGQSDTAIGEAELNRRDLMAVTNLLHPQYPELLLEVSSYEHTYRFDVDTGTPVRVTLRPSDDWRSYRQRLAVDEHAVLFANRGPLCLREEGVAGVPLAHDADGAGPDAGTTVTAFVAEPGVPWFIAVSGWAGSYTLEVQCVPEAL